ncbi:signal peptide peptidase SppA [Desulfogranum marinum]|uniref:signal peptide peptidase SppA n=1 Tax=Desulfogranum marinum TaxID=453220 RepID=UPI0029C61DBD|nr:signal peptide peptidase SppA [Desulfogranum marinum]
MIKKIFSFIWLPFHWFWKLLSAGMAVFASLLFLASLFLVVTTLFYRPEVTMPDDAVLIFAPEGDIVEQRSPIDPMAQVINNLSGVPVEKDILLQDVLDCIYTAADDSRINVLFIAPDRLGKVGLNQIKAIGKAVDYFKAAGKKVVAAGDNYNQAQYYLASWADEIYLNPMGGLRIQGFRVYRLYAKELLEKLAIDFHVFRVGTFKSALEPFTRNDMSPAAKEANKVWLDALWEIYSQDIATHRKMTSRQFKYIIDNLPTYLEQSKGDRSQMALQAGLIDGIKTRQELLAYLSELSNVPPDSSKKFPQISYKNYLQSITPSYAPAPEKKDNVGIITATGNIMYGKGAVNQIGSQLLIEQIRQAKKDNNIKALVLRISTGGGSAMASELIRQELLSFQQTGKPVVVSMGSMAASGGYWLAADADLIIASPVTLTGSIGIFGAIPTVNNTLKKIGVYGDGIGTSKTALFGNPVSAMSTAEKSYHQLSVENGYRQFLSIVSQGRDMSLDKVKMIAEGRVWDGKTAMRLGLVDQLGNLDKAIKEAAKLAGIDEKNAVYVAPRPSSLLMIFRQLGNFINTHAGLHISSAQIPKIFRQAVGGQWEILTLGLSSDPGDLYAHSLFSTAAFAF